MTILAETSALVRRLPAALRSAQGGGDVTAAERNVAGFPKPRKPNSPVENMIFQGDAKRASAAKATRQHHRKAEPAPGYVPGWWTEPVTRRTAKWPRGWPADFVSAPMAIKHSETLAGQMQLSANRERAAASGTGWADGTLVMANTPKWARPGRM